MHCQVSDLEPTRGHLGVGEEAHGVEREQGDGGVCAQLGVAQDLVGLVVVVSNVDEGLVRLGTPVEG